MTGGYQYVCKDCEAVLNPGETWAHKNDHGGIARLQRRDLYEAEHGEIDE